MKALTEKISSLKRRFDYKYFNFTTRNVRKLPLVQLDQDSKFTVLTMLCKRDVYQYLIAASSFCDYFRPSRFVVVSDGSLSKDDILLIKSKLAPCEFLLGNDYIDTRLPTYSSWQRILVLSELVQSSYVIQMDADIMTFSMIDEVHEAVMLNKPFMLGTDEGESIVSADAAQRFARSCYEEGERHLQCLCESNLDVFPDFQTLKYVRACAGFSGFPKHSFKKEQLMKISSAFEQRLGHAWPVWGSEQVTSNLLLANMNGVQVLPLRHYDSVERYNDALKMVHFIGSVRFQHGIYRELASTYIQRKLGS